MSDDEAALAERLWFHQHGRPVEDRLMRLVQDDWAGGGVQALRALDAAEAASAGGIQAMEALLLRGRFAGLTGKVLASATGAPPVVVRLMSEADVDVLRIYLAAPTEAARLRNRVDAAIDMHALVHAIDQGEACVPDTLPENWTD